MPGCTVGILCLQEPVLWSAALPTFPAHDTELLPVWVSSCAPSTLRCHGRTELAKHGLRPLHSAPWETILHTDGLLPQSGCMVSRCRPPQAVCSCFFFFGKAVAISAYGRQKTRTGNQELAHHRLRSCHSDLPAERLPQTRGGDRPQEGCRRGGMASIRPHAGERHFPSNPRGR